MSESEAWQCIWIICGVLGLVGFMVLPHARLLRASIRLGNRLAAWCRPYKIWFQIYALCFGMLVGVLLFIAWLHYAERY